MILELTAHIIDDVFHFFLESSNHFTWVTLLFRQFEQQQGFFRPFFHLFQTCVLVNDLVLDCLGGAWYQPFPQISLRPPPFYRHPRLRFLLFGRCTVHREGACLLLSRGRLNFSPFASLLLTCLKSDWSNGRNSSSIGKVC
jgi:hypothetical protein